MRARYRAGLGGAAAAIVAATAWTAPAWGMTGPGWGGVASGPVTQTTAQSTVMPAMAPASTAALDNDIAAARIATAKYATNLARAKADGYRIITMMMPSMGYHFLNPKISGFNVRRPPILVYEHTGRGWQLGALEWVFTAMPATPPLPDATFGTFPAACHYNDGTFIPDKNAATCPKKAPRTGAAFFFWHPELFTMHVWIWYPNPNGLYASTNPLVAPFNKN
jgi:hypothetical protein